MLVRHRKKTEAMRTGNPFVDALNSMADGANRVLGMRAPRWLYVFGLTAVLPSAYSLLQPRTVKSEVANGRLEQTAALFAHLSGARS
jgi:hypothetical protein